MDIDFREGKGCSLENLYNWLRDNSIINAEAIAGNIIKTRGGYHILVETEKIAEEYKKKWYNNFTQTKSDIFTVMANSDNMVPVPGCTQSNFSPILMKKR